MNKPAALLLHPKDNVWIACRDIVKGETIAISGVEVVVVREIPVGHKIAFVALSVGTKVIRYGAPIGSLTRDIVPGEHVHTHNLKSDYLPSHGRGAVDLKGDKT